MDPNDSNPEQDGLKVSDTGSQTGKDDKGGNGRGDLLKLLMDLLFSVQQGGDQAGDDSTPLTPPLPGGQNG